MRCFYVLLFGILSRTATAQQAILTQFPQDGQILQRNVSSNMGVANIRGRLPAGSDYASLELRVYQEGNLFQLETLNTTFSGPGDTLDFFFSASIPALCRNHRLELWGRQSGSQQYVFERAFQDIVAGDLFIINGQSNAIASASPFPDDLDPFTRSFFQPFGWGPLNLSFPGQWGGRLAKQLRDELNIPIAIFNGATGGVNITAYLRNDAMPDEGNYGALRQRLEASGYDHKVRAVLWYQGEADAWGQAISYYNGHLKTLQNAWIEDYAIEHLFLFQMRYRSCSSPLPLVLEAQRQFALADPAVSIMSTTNAAHDSCHYEYFDGYQALGTRMANLVLITLYGKNIEDALAPNPQKAWMHNPRRIAITVENTDSLIQLGTPWADFRLEGSPASITGGFLRADTIFLELSDSLNTRPHVSYLSHPGKAPDWIINKKGVGLLAFYDFPVDSMPVDTVTHVPVYEPFARPLLNIFPSPAQDWVQINWPSTWTPENIIIANMQGQICFHASAPENQIKIPLQDWPKGIYFVRLWRERGDWVLEKLLIN